MQLWRDSMRAGHTRRLARLLGLGAFAGGGLLSGCSGTAVDGARGMAGAAGGVHSRVAGASGTNQSGGGSGAGNASTAGASGSGMPGHGGVSADAGGNGVASSGMSTASLVDDWCWPQESLGCDGTNQRTRLVCGKEVQPKWQLAGQCAANEHCDTRPDNAGHCAPILSECLGHQPYQGSCAGNVYFECGADLVTRAFEQTCTDRCAPNSGGADCVQVGCGDGVESSTESCDDGNSQNGDGCSAGCNWEPPHGKLAAVGTFFGSPVAMSGDTIVVVGGDAPDGPLAEVFPAVYVYRSNGLAWSLEAKLVKEAISGGLALDGDTLAVGGADSADPAGGGAVFVFHRTGSSWVQQATLLPTLPDGTPDGSESLSFGSVLSLSPDTLVVGAHGDENQGAFSGAVYVFRRNGSSFAPEAKLVAALPDGTLDGVASGSFGQTVSLFGDTLAVGSLEARTGGGQAGAAYVFERSGASWSPTAKLVATLPNGTSDANAGDQFGSAVALRSDLLVVGSRYDGVYSGSAYVFRRVGSAWTPEARLVAPADKPGSNSSIAEFGQTVAIADSGKLIAIGSPRDRNQGAYSGSIHVFAQQGASWKAQAQLLAIPPRGASLNVAESEFGSSLAMVGDQILTGAYSAQGSGRAYLFRPKNDSWETRLELQALDPAASP